MKTLYESILDDEDILMGGVKQDLDNPLLCLYYIYKYTHNFNKDKKNAQKYSNKLVKMLNLKKGSAQIFESSITISPTKFINPRILSIYFDEMYKNSKIKCMIIKSSVYNNTLSKQDIENFSNKCNLKEVYSDTWILE
jgi:hypothetical protein